MNVVWAAAAPLTVREVREALLADRELAYTTVMTVMDRLLRKGLLDRTPHGKAYSYSAKQSRADFTAQMMADALQDSDDRSAALVHFAGQLTSQDRRALRNALDSRKR